MITTYQGGNQPERYPDDIEPIRGNKDNDFRKIIRIKTLIITETMVVINTILTMAKGQRHNLTVRIDTTIIGIMTNVVVIITIEIPTKVEEDKIICRFQETLMERLVWFTTS